MDGRGKVLYIAVLKAGTGSCSFSSSSASASLMNKSFRSSSRGAPLGISSIYRLSLRWARSTSSACLTVSFSSDCTSRPCFISSSQLSTVSQSRTSSFSSFFSGYSVLESSFRSTISTSVEGSLVSSASPLLLLSKGQDPAQRRRPRHSSAALSNSSGVWVASCKTSCVIFLNDIVRPSR